MKNILILIVSLLSLEAFATCTSPISRINNGTNSVLTSTKYNLDLNTIYNKVNALPGDCLTDETITGAKLTATTVTASKLAADSVTTVKIVDAAVTTAKIADGAITAAKVSFSTPGRLLRITSFTASGTWTRLSDVGSVIVEVTGGGGGGGGYPNTVAFGSGGGYALKLLASGSIPSSVWVTVGAGGYAGSGGSSGTYGGTGDTSSFGGIVSASGGTCGGPGGSGVGGDLNLTGTPAETSGGPGNSPKMNGGRMIGAPGIPNSGGGGGRYASTNNSGWTGGSGLVLIYEYSN